MKSLAPMGLIAILILSFCSCSAPSETAQTPAVAPIDSQATRLPKKSKDADLQTASQPQPVPQQSKLQPSAPEQPASIMARQLQDFAVEETPATGDSFFETQTSFEIPIVDQESIGGDVDFSGGLINN